MHFSTTSYRELQSGDSKVETKLTSLKSVSCEDSFGRTCVSFRGCFQAARHTAVSLAMYSSLTLMQTGPCCETTEIRVSSAA